MSNVYTILVSRKLKTKNVRHHPTSVIRQNKTKVFGVKNEILIKYKRIKWTPSRKASHLLPEGKNANVGKKKPMSIVTLVILSPWE